MKVELEEMIQSEYADLFATTLPRQPAQVWGRSTDRGAENIVRREERERRAGGRLRSTVQLARIVM